MPTPYFAGRRVRAMTLVLAVAAAAAFTGADPALVAQTPQAPPPCSLLTHDDLGAVFPGDQVGDGVATASAAHEFSACRYAWGIGTLRQVVEVSVNPSARAYPGMTAEAIKQRFESSLAQGTGDAMVPEIGDAAIFRAYSPMFAGATAHVKDRVLQVTIDGYDAALRKDAVVALLKAAAARL